MWKHQQVSKLLRNVVLKESKQYIKYNKQGYLFLIAVRLDVLLVWSEKQNTRLLDETKR